MNHKDLLRKLRVTHYIPESRSNEICRLLNIAIGGIYGLRLCTSAFHWDRNLIVFFVPTLSAEFIILVKTECNQANVTVKDILCAGAKAHKLGAA